jgi:hypothetical protein
MAVTLAVMPATTPFEATTDHRPACRVSGDALRLESYIQDADRDGDTELAEFFRRAEAESRRGAAQGNQLLLSRLASAGPQKSYEGS